MLISIEGHSVADFDTQSACNRWQTTMLKASWIQSTLYDYRRFMLMGMVITFPGNYCVGEGNTINKSISISLYLLNASCSLNEIAEKIRIKYMLGKSLGC
jgi:hypothetical protein